MATGESKRKSILVLLVAIIVIAIVAVVWQTVRAVKKPEVPVAPFDIGPKGKGMGSKDMGMKAPTPGGAKQTL